MTLAGTDTEDTVHGLGDQQGPPGEGPDEQVPIRPEERRQRAIVVEGHGKD